MPCLCVCVLLEWEGEVSANGLARGEEMRTRALKNPQRPAVAAVILGARNAAHLDDARRLFSFALTDRDISEARALGPWWCSHVPFLLLRGGHPTRQPKNDDPFAANKQNKTAGRGARARGRGEALGRLLLLGTRGGMVERPAEML